MAEVADRFGIPEDPARYWLQLLALHNPTDTNINLWNGWRKAEREWAAAPLLEQDLIVRAKRARAGRSLFLPGGWQEAKPPTCPWSRGSPRSTTSRRRPRCFLSCSW